MSCNSSNINLSKTFVSVTNGGSRLMITIPDSKCATGITYGSVIRYDPSANQNTGQYRLSNASTVVTSEVIGIVESINTDASKNVVIYGSVDLPESSIEDIPAGYTGGSGGSDIYFLSGTSSGKLRNSAPDDINHVVKSVYQKAPHGNGAYTGVIMNYIGYKINGEDISSATVSFDGNTQNNIEGLTDVFDPDSNSGVGLIKTMLIKEGETYQIPDTFVDASVSHLLPATEYPEYFNYYGYYSPIVVFGTPITFIQPQYRLFVEYCYVNSNEHTVNASNIGRYITKDANSYAEIIDYDPSANAYLVSHNFTDESAFVCTSGVNYGIATSVGGNNTLGSTFTMETVVPYGMWTPTLQMASSTFILDDSGSSAGAKIIVLLKVRSGNSAALDSFQNNTLRTTNLTLNNEDVNLIVTDLQNRIEQLETRSVT